jgi:serine/threonine protein kinase
MDKYNKYIKNKKKLNINSLSSIYLIIKNNKQLILKEEYKICYNKEHKILEKLNHSNIIKLIDHFHDSKKDYIIMEYFIGKTLKHFKFNNEEIIRIYFEILKTVRYIHQKEVIHLDLSENNILYNGHDIKIIDFGNSEEIDKKCKIYYDYFGRWQNLSPETIKNGNIGYFNDIWALGILLYNLVYKKEPFYNKKFILNSVQYKDNNKNINSIIKYIFENYLDIDIDKIINYINSLILNQ